MEISKKATISKETFSHTGFFRRRDEEEKNIKRYFLE